MYKYIYYFIALAIGIGTASCSKDDDPNDGENQTTSQSRLMSIYYAEERMYIFSNPEYDSKGRLLGYTGDVDEEFRYLYYSDNETSVKYTYGSSEINVTYKDNYSTEKWTYSLNGGLISQCIWMDKGVTPQTEQYEYDSNKRLKSITEITNDHQWSDYEYSWGKEGPNRIETYFTDYSYKYLDGQETIMYGSRNDNTVIPGLVLSWLTEESLSAYSNGYDPFLFYEGYLGTYPSTLPYELYAYDEDNEITKKVSVTYNFNDKGLVSKIIANIGETDESRAKTVTLNIEWE